MFSRSSHPRFFGLALVALLCAGGALVHAEDRAAVVIATGAEGDAAYAGLFEKWAGSWETAAKSAGAAVSKVGAGEGKDPLGELHGAIEAKAGASTEPLWVVLLGHGTDDGRDAKFNLRGADLSVSELAKWLGTVQRPLVVICGFSSSGSFLKPLSGAGRVIVCATRTGRENNFSRFGGFLSGAIADPAADLDKDGATSLLEAWLAAARSTADFYKNEGRLATEHSLLDDNGDGSGTPADWFQGVRAVKRAKSNQVPDGLRAHQTFLVPSAADQSLSPDARKQRDTLEAELAKLREAKASLAEDDYFAKLEAILLQIARLYRSGN